jgi:hypothetical protein
VAENPLIHFLPDEWFIGFGPAGIKTIWHRLLAHAPFEHVFAFTFDPVHKSWLLVDPALNKTMIGYVDGEMIDQIVALTAAKEGRIIRAVSQPVGDKAPLFPGAIYCVTQINRLLGQPVRAATPKGLHDKLLKAGIAEPAFLEAFDG